MRRCIVEDKCYENYESMVLGSLDGNNDLVQKAKELSKKIAEDFRNKNVKPFMPEK